MWTVKCEADGCSWEQSANDEVMSRYDTPLWPAYQQHRAEIHPPDSLPLLVKDMLLSMGDGKPYPGGFWDRARALGVVP